MPTSFPARLYVEVTTRCNLRCRMCVKQAEGCRIPEGDMPLAVFDRLASCLPHLDALVLNGVGEPLLHPDLPAMVRLARRHMRPDADIGFQTNGLPLTPDMARALTDGGVDRVCLSVDALATTAREELPGCLHGGMDAGSVARAMDMLRAAARGRARPLRLGVEFVLMRDNAEELPGVVRWAAARGAEFCIVTHVLPYDAAAAAQSLFVPDTDEARAFFDRRAADAARLGLDLRRYFDVVWKFAKSPEEKALVDFVLHMRQDAAELGISLHVKRLVNGMDAPVPDLGPLFEAARAAAAETGMDLRLPRTGPSVERRCDFVEDGAAFVTADGSAHPCYFLWHRYACFLDGEPKQVFPRTFGSLADATLEELWNGAEWREFRDEVRAYRYPDCTNCPTGPCDDITGAMGEFDIDCHGVAVPCGHCPWCLGGVQCLR